MIALFRNKYFFLSNFFPCQILYNGLTYQNAEAAFQAQKDVKRSKEFTKLNPSQAKYLGRRVQLRKDWEQVKDNIMYEIVKAKFTQNEQLKTMLLNTGEEKLLEGNNWHDTYWGVNRSGQGKNMLGKILMKVREEIKNTKK